MIFNEQYSREEYEKIKSELKLDTKSGINNLGKKCHDFLLKYPRKNVYAEHNQNCIGNRLTDSKDCFYCFNCKDLEDCRYCMRLAVGIKQSMDYTGWGMNAELVYDCVACGDHVYNLKFCTNCTTNLTDCEYCHQCTGSRDLFGCVGLKKKQYCILNKQYTKEEYFALKEKIIEHMRKTNEYGEFFPSEICPFGYNETIAMDCFPASKEEVLKMGFQWRDPEVKEVQPQTCEIPDSIGDVKDSITNEVLVCAECNKNFKIISQELKLYRQMAIPVPHVCSACRHIKRMKKLDPPELWERKCAKCGETMHTCYAPNRPETIYCEKCYLKEVY